MHRTLCICISYMLFLPSGFVLSLTSSRQSEVPRPRPMGLFPYGPGPTWAGVHINTKCINTYDAVCNTNDIA